MNINKVWKEYGISTEHDNITVLFNEEQTGIILRIKEFGEPEPIEYGLSFEEAKVLGQFLVGFANENLEFEDNECRPLF